MNSLFSSSNFIDAVVHKVSLPGSSPGASIPVLRSLTLTISTPGILFAAFIIALSFETTIKGPFLTLYFLPLSFPFPDLILFFSTLSNSFSNPMALSAFSTSCVLLNPSNLLSNIKGKLSGIMWHLFFTRSFMTVADIPDLIAFLLSFLFIFLPRFFSALGGCALLPPLVLGAKAPTKYILVPLLDKIFLGVLDMPWPYDPLYLLLLFESVDDDLFPASFIAP